MCLRMFRLTKNFRYIILLLQSFQKFTIQRPAYKLLNSYLMDRKQRVRIKNSFTKEILIICDVPQDTILSASLVCKLNKKKNELNIHGKLVR